ncbi:MAG: hypothetical protein EAY72_01785 [Bacteroidetes bacterium]|nr:MAG: hypothetical protein EAY72_01785 [Bacteroidota bacterium]
MFDEEENDDFNLGEELEQMQHLVSRFEGLQAGRIGTFLDEEAFEKLIDYFQENDYTAKANDAVELGLQFFPKSASLLIRKADLLLVARKYLDCLAVLEEVEILDQSDINLYILQTDAYLAIDQQEKAVQVLEKALTMFEGAEKIDLLFELADVYDDYEEFDKVFDCLQMVLDAEPTNEEALYKICFWADFTGRNEESIQLHKNIIEKLPYSELAWFNLACAYQGLKLYEKAIDAYEYCISIDEKFEYAYRNMGDAYIRLRKYKDAIEVLQKVLSLTRPEDVIYEAIGHCFDRMNNYAQARFHYRKASHLNPEDSKLNYKIALTYMQEGQYVPAVKQLEHAMRIHKGNADYNMAMGECKLQLEQYEEAVFYFSSAIKHRPKNTAAWEALIESLYKLTQFEEASRQCERAYLATDRKPIFIYLQSACLLQMSQSKQAILLLEQAIELAPKLVKKFIDLNPAVLQYGSVVDVLARYKKNKKI